jgi:hypothetical protein
MVEWSERIVHVLVNLSEDRVVYDCRFGVRLDDVVSTLDRLHRVID